MPEPTPSSYAQVLWQLRQGAGWSRAQLAQALGHADESLISAYERGAKALTREQLDSLVEPLAPPEAVDLLLFANGLVSPEPQEEAPSPVALTPKEQRVIDRAAMAAGATAGRLTAGDVRAELIRTRKQEKVAAARHEAEGLFDRLLASPRLEWRRSVEVIPVLWKWALAERACAVSIRRAAHDAKEALELAELAVAIAERVPEEESWRSRLQGYCWAHVANARRVANDFPGADEAFARAWELWRAGASSQPEPLAEWRLFSLEASLRRDQLRFAAALELLDRARSASQGKLAAVARILLKQGNIFTQMGDFESALNSLVEAAPLVEGSGDPRLIFGLRFDTANNLCCLKRYGEAARLLPAVRELAIQQRNELDLMRVGWLSARVAAGEGREEEAIGGLELVCRAFTARNLPYDAALASLDLAALWLKDGRLADVKELAVAMGWIFEAQGIDREALAALALFCEAAKREIATEELTRRILAEVERVRRSAPQK